MKTWFFLFLTFSHLFRDVYAEVVWSSSFETNESDTWSVTSGNQPFQRVLYSNLNGIPVQSKLWALSAVGVNNQLLLPQVKYYGGSVDVSFYAYAVQSSSNIIATIQFLDSNFFLIQSNSLSLTINSWNYYAVSLPSNQLLNSAFSVSFMYSGDSLIYIDSVLIKIEGILASCISITSSNNCRFTLSDFNIRGWKFLASGLTWNNSPGYSMATKSFLYLGGLLKGSIGVTSNQYVQLTVTIPGTSFRKIVTTISDSFDLTASTQYTVGQTYTIEITSATPAVTSTLKYFNLYVGGNCNSCNANLRCISLPNGVSCFCDPKTSCTGLNQQCIVSTNNTSANPCSCLPGYTLDDNGNCV